MTATAPPAPLDEEAKKRALRMVPYGLYVVGVRAAKVEDPARDLNAFIASWVSQASFKPPLVTLGVRKDSRSNGLIRESGVFVLNLLGAGQKALATRFFKDLVVDDTTLSGVPYRLGATGAPILPDLPAFVECRLVAVHDHGGDHDVFVGEVVAAGHAGGDARPLTHEETGWNYGG